MTTYKTCSKCGEDKPLSEYNRHKSTRDKLRPECKACEIEYRRRWYKKNAEEVKAKSREWHAANRQKAIEKSRNYYQTNKERLSKQNQEWREAHKAKTSEYGRDWYSRNRARVLDMARKYRTANREKISAKDRRYKQANPERIRANNVKRKAVKRNAEGHFTPADIRALLKAQRGRCVYCQADIIDCYTVDHMTPLSRGGSNWPDNLQLLCVSCNSSKHDKTHDEYLSYLASSLKSPSSP